MLAACDTLYLCVPMATLLNYGILSYLSVIVLQVTVEYRIEHGACIPIRVHTIVISVQHSEEITLEDMRKELMEKVVKVRWYGVILCSS